MRTIYKYPLCGSGTFEFPMPVGAEILTVQMQAGFPCIWALVESGNRVQIRSFIIYGTGQPVDADVTDRNYVGTVQDGSWVWHVFELAQPAAERGEENKA